MKVLYFNMMALITSCSSYNDKDASSQFQQGTVGHRPSTKMVGSGSKE